MAAAYGIASVGRQRGGSACGRASPDGRQTDARLAAGGIGYYGHSEPEEGPLKKLVFLMLLILVGVGAYFAWKMLKGDGGCCGWGGDNTDPWSSYTPPAEEETPAA
jgi:hypothetical protein